MEWHHTKSANVAALNAKFHPLVDWILLVLNQMSLPTLGVVKLLSRGATCLSNTASFVHLKLSSLKIIEEPP